MKTNIFKAIFGKKATTKVETVETENVETTTNVETTSFNNKGETVFFTEKCFTAWGALFMDKF